METLQHLYEIKHKNRRYFERKLKITSKRTIIKGARKSGKTSLIIDYMQKFSLSETLYIDINDERIDKNKISNNLIAFIKSNPIKLLVIESYDPTIPIPDVEEIILTCNSSIDGFNDIRLFPLDFEEFISFDKRHNNAEQIFNLYAKRGSFPQIVLKNSNNPYKEMQDMLHVILYNETEFEIFKKCSEFQNAKLSLFQIYNQLKTNMKISKDKLYEKVKTLQDENMIFLVEKLNSPRASKKLFLIDFALKNALTFKREFLKRFENMVFLELIKKEKKIFYTDYLDMYMPDSDYAVLCIPFLPQESIQKKLEKSLLHVKDLGIKKIDIVTIGNEGEFWLKNIRCSILPFWDWALKD